jgi:hypothetical protein
LAGWRGEIPAIGRQDAVEPGVERERSDKIGWERQLAKEVVHLGEDERPAFGLAR